MPIGAFAIITRPAFSYSTPTFLLNPDFFWGISRPAQEAVLVTLFYGGFMNIRRIKKKTSGHVRKPPKPGNFYRKAGWPLSVVPPLILVWYPCFSLVPPPPRCGVVPAGCFRFARAVA